MDIQEILTYVIVGIAAVLTARIFIRQFTSADRGCAKCPHCGPEQNASVRPSDRLIQVEDRTE